MKESERIYIISQTRFNAIISQRKITFPDTLFFDAINLLSRIHLLFSNHGVIPAAFAQVEQARNFLERERLPARVPIPIRSRLYIRWRGGAGEGRRSHRYALDTCTCVPAYVMRSVFRVYANAIHICAETGFHRLASAHIGITLSLT